MQHICESMDDLPQSKLFAKIHKLGNEKFLFDKNQSAKMIDSAIFSLEELNQHEDIQDSPDMNTISSI